MNYCCECGAPVVRRIPPGDTLPRHVCESCQTIHYLNPKMVIGAIPEWQGRLLLCRRAIEPRRGLWTLPAGFMENGETTAQAAIRETFEEACARIEIGPLFSLIDIPFFDQVHLFYRAQLIDPAHAPGEESLETQLFDEASIPWEEIAFRSTRRTLEDFFSDRQAGCFGMHTHALPPPPGYSQK